MRGHNLNNEKSKISRQSFASPSIVGHSLSSAIGAFTFFLSCALAHRAFYHAHTLATATSKITLAKTGTFNVHFVSLAQVTYYFAMPFASGAGLKCQTRPPALVASVALHFFAMFGRLRIGGFFNVQFQLQRLQIVLAFFAFQSDIFFNKRLGY